MVFACVSLNRPQTSLSKQVLTDHLLPVQGQVHYINETLYNCHTSCDLLNAGTFQSELETIVAWLQDNPFEVLTMLIGNSDLAFVEEFRIPIENSGISQYLYTPMYIPQHKDQWPTLGEMILSNNRVVMFMDYYANQDSVPYILEEFTHMWETPFSPQNPDFPCTIERPPGLAPEDAHENFMYMANHNLNVAVELGSLTGALSEPLLLPNTAQINNTNGQGEDHGQLGAMAMNCSSKFRNQSINTQKENFPKLTSNRNRRPRRPSQFPARGLLQPRQPQPRLRLRSRRKVEQRHLQPPLLRARRQPRRHRAGERAGDGGGRWVCLFGSMVMTSQFLNLRGI
jgi:hypothetical protein